MAVWDKLGPDYNPNTWKLGYFARHPGQGSAYGVVPTVLDAMSNPPQAMIDAAAVVEIQADDTQ